MLTFCNWTLKDKLLWILNRIITIYIPKIFCIALSVGVLNSAAQLCTWSLSHDSWGWRSLNQFPSSRYFLNFQNNQNIGYLYNITFIFGRRHRSWATEPPVKYERDEKNLSCTYAISKFPITEKLAKGAVVTPTTEALSIKHYMSSKNSYTSISDTFL